MAKKKSTKQDDLIPVIVGNGTGGYGLWFGYITKHDADTPSLTSVKLFKARSIRYWYGRSGGITSLATHGLCGPRAKESRVGNPAPFSNVVEVKAIHACTPEATATFESVVNT